MFELGFDSWSCCWLFLNFVLLSKRYKRRVTNLNYPLDMKNQVMEKPSYGKTELGVMGLHAPIASCIGGICRACVCVLGCVCARACVCAWGIIWIKIA